MRLDVAIRHLWFMYCVFREVVKKKADRTLFKLKISAVELRLWLLLISLFNK